jgi:hypothetical protein
MEYINKIGIFIFGEMANCLPKPELPFILELWVFKAIGNQELDSQLPLRLGDWISPTECKQRYSMPLPHQVGQKQCGFLPVPAQSASLIQLIPGTSEAMT